jgi:hypothetical protein
VKRLTRFLVCLSLLAVSGGPALAGRDHGDYPGYRERPYDKHRHYRHDQYQGHRYIYRGHWRSWHDWDRYYRAHPHLHGHGHYYYHDHTHLMFRYCEPDGSGCFFFSIGR